MKICVYAICKNESKFVDRWVDSMSEADEIYVLDTGSEDNTVELLKSRGVHVEVKYYEQFRFDQARNDSLKLLPKDTNICVCTDLDEVWTKGWRKELEKVWGQNTKRARYKYVWNYKEDGSEGYTFFADKIHSYGDFDWIHPVHEVLKSNIKEYESVQIQNATLEHHADDSKSRKQYLPLLELSVKENPYDDRNVHYLGREYMFSGQWEKAIETLKKHLELPTATWSEERCASLRFIARCQKELNRLEMAEFYFKLAICECPTSREPFYELGMFYYEKGKYLDSATVLYSMLNITNRALSYVSDPACWGGDVYDVLSICNYYLGNKKEAIANCIKAIEFAPNDERLIGNLNIYNNMK